MNAPLFFTDEDVYAAVARGLRKAKLDAVSTPESGRLGESVWNSPVEFPEFASSGIPRILKRQASGLVPGEIYLSPLYPMKR